jgi:hypothetical protein
LDLESSSISFFFLAFSSRGIGSLELSNAAIQR